jgi:hypothetical protein
MPGLGWDTKVSPGRGAVNDSRTLNHFLCLNLTVSWVEKCDCSLLTKPLRAGSGFQNLIYRPLGSLLDPPLPAQQHTSHRLEELSVSQASWHLQGHPSNAARRRTGIRQLQRKGSLPAGVYNWPLRVYFTLACFVSKLWSMNDIYIPLTGFTNYKGKTNCQNKKIASF